MVVFQEDEKVGFLYRFKVSPTIHNKVSSKSYDGCNLTSYYQAFHAKSGGMQGVNNSYVTFCEEGLPDFLIEKPEYG
jgi:hypothetical protein